MTDKLKLGLKRVLFTAAILVLWMSDLPAQQSNPGSPNIVFILADDLTRWDIGAYGSKDAITPTIDRLASGGMKFTNVHQASPICSPTRHNIYTGMYPTRSGAHPNHTHVEEGIKSVVDYLEPLNYRVALAGKRHIGPRKIFDFEYLDNKKDPQFDKVEAFIKDAASKERPFCLFLNSNQPHGPLTKGDPSLFDAEEMELHPYLVDTEMTREKFRGYLAEINYLDGQVKQALHLLEKYDISDNTVVMFASEQGSSLPFGKWTLYNAGLGSALIVRWPGVTEPGSVSNALADYSDILPTIIDIAGGQPVRNLDGSSLVPVFKGEKDTHKDFSYGIMTTRGIFNGSDYFPIRSITDGKYRYIMNLTPEVQFSNVVIKGALWKEWKDKARKSEKAAQLVNRYLHRQHEELYNDEKDPYNMNNLADDEQYAEIKKKLRAKLLEWMECSGDKGLYTELMAFEHQGKNNANGDSVQIYYELQPAVGEDLKDSDVRYEFYTGFWSSFPDFSSLSSKEKQGTTASISSGVQGISSQPYGVVYKINITVPRKGYYTFYAKTSQTGKVFVDDKLVVAVKGDIRNFGRYGIIGMHPGKHKIRVEYVNENDKADDLKVQWSGPDMEMQEL